MTDISRPSPPPHYVIIYYYRRLLSFMQYPSHRRKHSPLAGIDDNIQARCLPPDYISSVLEQRRRRRQMLLFAIQWVISVITVVVLFSFSDRSFSLPLLLLRLYFSPHPPFIFCRCSSFLLFASGMQLSLAIHWR